ncbi:MAG: C13 family peptidase [Burkholderiaceae bacterium]
MPIFLLSCLLTRWRGRARHAFSLLLLCWLPLGLAASSPQASVFERSNVLLAQQIEQLRLGDPAAPVLAVFAMHSESMAFEGDAELTLRTARQYQPGVRVLRLGNGWSKPGSKSRPPVLDYPFATRESMALALSAIAEHSRPETPVTLMFTSHGNQGVLGVKLGSRDYPPVSASDLSTWLAGLGQRPTLVLLSACYSGSLIDAVSGPQRLVLTAASAERSSFGCNFSSRNTFFIEELLGPASAVDVGFEQHVRETWSRIARREKDLKYGPPSNPQMHVGDQMTQYAAASWTQWWRGSGLGAFAAEGNQ